MKHGQFLRIAMRVEGKWWVAYMAALDTMIGAVPIARIRFDAAHIPEIKEGFTELCKLVMVKAAGVANVGPVTDWSVREAPEHERSDNA